MRENLHLPHEKVDAIKNQIEKLVESRKSQNKQQTEGDANT